MDPALAHLQTPVPASVWQTAAACFVGYAVLYRTSAELSKRFIPAYKRLTHGKQVDWNTRLPSTVHAVLVSALCLHELLTGAFGEAASVADGVPAVVRTTPGSWLAVGLSLGYFAADAFMVISQEAIWSAMILVHHCMALVSLATAIDIRSAHAYVLFGLFTEITTPFVNLRWRLHEAGAAGGRAYLVNGLAMTAVWGACRVAAFGPLFAHVRAHFGEAVRYLPPYAVGVMLGVPALLFVLNLLWFAKMLQGAAKLVRRCGARGRGGKARDATVLVEAYAAPGGRKSE
ncbi:hypothetical protein Rsub_09356 [Raphidocelis subcapitata]|uniref:TLC domain-containing protein n=1 Tax=Raphidocelis subcapitata TaxID=307507 RepID=A0A2V0PFE4_9CHLO|nr:hypothetical protein Rsub_09356 [Raphidocelis subcapitata]|eukprot:GBF96610.1 hypothetical protein Rsub_09356 [Raphidocelis subcapitata]